MVKLNYEAITLKIREKSEKTIYSGLKNDYTMGFFRSELLALFTILLLFSSVYALQQVAGTLRYNLVPDSKGVATFGLINDGNETISVKLRAEGDTAAYLTYPETVQLEPKKLTYANVTAYIPADYKGSGNLTGYMYALQEGKPGQVQINVQMRKGVNILISGAPTGPAAEVSGSVGAAPAAEPQEAPERAITGLATLSTNPIVIGIGILIIILLGYIFFVRKTSKGKHWR